MTVSADFRAAYAAHRAAEGRRLSCGELMTLPYIRSRYWEVRARTFEAFARLVAQTGATRVLDLGAGNGWLSYRLTLAGVSCVAVDVRDDDVDGLGAAACYRGISRVVASFDDLPLDDRQFDIAVFNAALHYAFDLRDTIRETRRVVRSGGRICVLDTPFYASESDGDAMVSEKRASGEYRAELLEPPFIEYLTAERLETASALRWRRHRVTYPLWYELRPVAARLRGKRTPSRFDLWESTVP
jgi:SAM-dependent methyltransferase